MDGQKMEPVSTYAPTFDTLSQALNDIRRAKGDNQ